MKSIVPFPAQVAIWLAVMGSCLPFSIPAWSQPASPEVLFDGVTVHTPWKVTATEGTSLKAAKDGIQFTIDAWQAGHNMWPGLQFSGAPVDLSQYSMLQLDIENPTDQAEDIVIAANENQQRRAARSLPVPPHTTIKATLNIADSTAMDPSSITQISLYLSRPLTSSTYILKKISAVLNPDYISPRTALEQRLLTVQRAAKRFFQNAKLAKNAAAQWQNSQQLIAAAQLDFDQKIPGYLTAAQKKLDTAQQNLAQLAMNLRNTNLLVWTSPLGLAIRNGTLPESTSEPLTGINKRVCLNEYKAICVNISTASEPRTVDVILDKKSAPGGLITLRPTLFAKARDGSETADAIGASCSELSLKIAPYQTQQFIVWINTKIKNIQAGDYGAQLELTSSGEKERTKILPIGINIVNLHLPSSLPVSIINWAYFYMGQVHATAGLEREAVDNLRDYGVNTWIINYDQVPLPLLNSAGKYAGLNETDHQRMQRFRQVMDLLKGNPQETFIIWLGFQRPEVREALSRQDVLKEYLKDLHALMDEYQVPVEKRYLEFWDEPKLDQVEESIEWMKKIHALDPTWHFFDDTSSVPLNQDLTDYIHLIGRWIPNWEQFFIAQPDAAKELESLKIPHLGFYRCLMSRNNRGVNIYEYYRLMGWYAMQHGFDNLGFWTYNSGAGEDVWDGTIGPASGGVVIYSKDGKLFTSRRWELFREGLDDYLLAQAAFGNNGILDARKNPALMSLCRQVTNHPENFELADAVREKLINMALQNERH